MSSSGLLETCWQAWKAIFSTISNHLLFRITEAAQKRFLTCFIILLHYLRYNFVYLHTVPWALTLAIRLRMVCQKLATLKDQCYCSGRSLMASEPNWELDFLTNNLLESWIRIAEKSRTVFSLLGVIDKLLLYLCRWLEYPEYKISQEIKAIFHHTNLARLSKIWAL